jgi:hypothetical protein
LHGVISSALELFLTELITMMALSKSSRFYNLFWLTFH